jgi:hypothetical protein
MNKLMLTAALALTLGAGAASAQSLVGQPVVTDQTGGFVVRQAALPRSPVRVSPYSAFARNVGPGSSVTGRAENDFGAFGSGDDLNARAPSAGSLGIGGN